jgi:hypothetical protein
MKYPASNYKEIRSAIKAEYKALTETHTKSKREGYSSLYEKVRIQHIAYSMFKGSTFDQIESKWKQPENPMHNYIKRQALALYDSYMKRIVVSIAVVAEDAIEF